MPDPGSVTRLTALPPSVGDAAVAALLLRDIAAALGARRGTLAPEALEVDDASRFHVRAEPVTDSPVDLQHAELAAPELFDGAEPDELSDVYTAALLALTRYLGASPVLATEPPHRAPQAVRLAMVRQAQRTAPAHLGGLVGPFRGAFVEALAKERHLRPTPARLVALLDAAFAAAGPTAEADARARVHRLIVLARVFQPVGSAGMLKPPPAIVRVEAPTPLHLPLRTIPAFNRPGGAARVALIAAVTIVATGGVAVAAVVGFGGGSGKTPTPQAVATFPTPSSTSGPTVGPADATTAPAPAASIVPPAGGATGGPGVGYSDPGSGNGGTNCLRVQTLHVVALDDDPTDPGSPTSSDSSTPTPTPDPSTTAPSSTPPSTPTSTTPSTPTSTAPSSPTSTAPSSHPPATTPPVVVSPPGPPTIINPPAGSTGGGSRNYGSYSSGC